MRVLILGANGFIGSAVAAHLIEQGHDVTLSTRGRVPISLRSINRVTIDIAKTTEPSAWISHLRGMEAVVNCAGLLQDSRGNSTVGVHFLGLRALLAACEQAGVRRIVHVSALGVAQDAPTAFSRTKFAGDEAIMSCNLDWIILRPSVVVGRAAYGGSALLRGLAALPVLLLPRNAGSLQIVHLHDLVCSVSFFLQPGATSHQVLEIVGPRRWALEDVIGLFRRWLGWAPAVVFQMPNWFFRVLSILGDGISLLGWRPPIRSTALTEIVRGSTGDPSPWTSITGIQPRDLEASLAAEPPAVQERWFAAMFLLKPLILVSLSLFWIVSGLVTLGPGFAYASRLLHDSVFTGVAGPMVVAGGLVDLVVGCGIAARITARAALRVGIAISIIYAVAGTLALPQLWADPLGALLKIVPIIALHLTALAILDDR